MSKGEFLKNRAKVLVESLCKWFEVTLKSVNIEYVSDTDYNFETVCAVVDIDFGDVNETKFDIELTDLLCKFEMVTGVTLNVYHKNELN